MYIAGAAGQRGLPGPPGKDGKDGAHGEDGEVGLPGVAGLYTFVKLGEIRNFINNFLYIFQELQDQGGFQVMNMIRF